MVETVSGLAPREIKKLPSPEKQQQPKAPEKHADTAQSPEAKTIIAGFIDRQKASSALAHVRNEVRSLGKGLTDILKYKKRQLASAVVSGAISAQDVSESVNNIVSPDTGNTEQQYAQVLQQKKVDQSKDFLKGFSIGIEDKPRSEIASQQGKGAEQQSVAKSQRERLPRKRGVGTFQDRLNQREQSITAQVAQARIKEH